MNLSSKIKDNFRKLFNLETLSPVITEGVEDREKETAEGPSPEPVPELAEAAEVAEVADGVVKPDTSDSIETLITSNFSRFHAMIDLPGLQQSENGEFTFQNGDEILTLNASQKLEAILLSFESLKSGLDNALSEIQSLNEKLAARPTTPKQVSDPQVSVALASTEKDETGKQILQNLPHDLRVRLRQQPTAKS